MQPTTNDEQLRNLAFNIAFLRQQHHLSKTAMAALLRISVRTLNRLERGEVPRALGASILVRIHQHFGVRPSELLIQRLQP